MTVEIEPLPASDLAQVAHFTLPPDQAPFADHPNAVLETPGRDGHVILQDGRPVGFFAIEPGYGAAYDFAPDDAIGLRMFSINHADQGKGAATAAARALRTYLAARYPGHPTCYLTVNLKNPAARRVYEKGGFTDTGELYLDGGYGPQHVMRLDLERQPAP